MAGLIEQTDQGPNRRPDETGSLMVDILIGMAILGLLAFIVASGVSGWRLQAYKTIALADAQKVSHMAAAIPKDTVVDQQTINQVNAHLTPGSRLIDPAKDATGRVTFCVEHTVDGDPKAHARYDTAEGGLYDRGPGGC